MQISRLTVLQDSSTLIWELFARFKMQDVNISSLFCFFFCFFAYFFFFSFIQYDYIFLVVVVFVVVRRLCFLSYNFAYLFFFFVYKFFVDLLALTERSRSHLFTHRTVLETIMLTSFFSSVFFSFNFVSSNTSILFTRITSLLILLIDLLGRFCFFFFLNKTM